MELSDYLRVLRRHWRLVLACVLVTLTIAAIYDLARPKVYEASAAGFVATNQTGSTAESSIGDTLAKSRATSYVDVAQSRSTGERAAKSLGTGASPSALIGRIDVSQPTDTVLIRVTAKGSSPREATDLANAWIEALSQEVEHLEGKGEGSIRLVPQESAATPSSPVTPNPRRDLPLALALGLLLGLGAAVLRAQLDRRVRTPDGVRDLGLPTLTSIPMSKALGRSKGRMPVITGDRNGGEDAASSEAIRRLRTNLRFMDVDNPPRVIVVTSPNEGDGKSTIASNLAASVAAAGQSTVLVDADLRRPVLASGLGVSEGAGLTDVLTGESSLEDVLQPSGASGNLLVLGAGNLPPNPSEILGSRAMRSAVRQLAQSHFVVIDAPPVLPVTDAAVLGTGADGVILVVSAGKSLDTHVLRAVDEITDVNGRVLGIVLNKVSRRDASSYYGGSTRYYETETAS